MTNLQAYTRIALALMAFWLAVAWIILWNARTAYGLRLALQDVRQRLFNDRRHTALLVGLRARVLGKRHYKVAAEPRLFTALDQPVGPVTQIDARGEVPGCFPWSHEGLPRKQRWSRPV